MRAKLAVAGATAAAALLVGAGAARADGFYVSGTIAGVFRDSLTRDFSNAADPFGNRASNDGTPVRYQQQERYTYQAGGEADVAGGYRFGLGRWGAIRAEGEFGFRDYRLGASTVQSLPDQVYATVYHATITTLKGGYIERYAETANAFYDLPAFGFATPYVGAGVGYQEGVQTPTVRLHQVQITQGATGSIAGPTTAAVGSPYLQSEPSSSGDDGTWLVEGGVSLKMTPHLSLTPSYRYSQAFGGHTPVNQARIGLRYSF